ncbi:MAG: winged helix-turn-helix domain-containing protein [Candidatus Binataceae bacterium]
MSQQFDFRKLDSLIHVPARLAIMAVLAVQKETEFTALSRRLDLTDGNLSSHLRTLEEAEYIRCTKSFVGRRPRTTYRILQKGRAAFERYIDELEKIALGNGAK